MKGWYLDQYSRKIIFFVLPLTIVKSYEIIHEFTYHHIVFRKQKQLFHEFTCGLLLPELGLIANDVKMKYAIVTTEMMQLNCNGLFV